MKGVHKVTYILAKISEIAAWIIAAISLILFITSLTAGEWLSGVLLEDVSIQPLNILGMDIQLAVTDGGMALMSEQMLNAVRAVLPLLAVAGGVCLSLFAMVFRNVGLIIKLSHGLTKNAKGATPFQPDVIRMIKEIGYFYIAIPVVEIIMSVILRLVAGPEYIEISVGLGSIFTALVMFSLAQMFAYGTTVQKDVDGLL